MGVGVDSGVGEGVGVSSGVGSGVGLRVGSGVEVGEAVGVGVGVGDGFGVGVLETAEGPYVFPPTLVLVVLIPATSPATGKFFGIGFELSSKFKELFVFSEGCEDFVRYANKKIPTITKNVTKNTQKVIKTGLVLIEDGGFWLACNIAEELSMIIILYHGKYYQKLPYSR